MMRFLAGFFIIAFSWSQALAQQADVPNSATAKAEGVKPLHEAYNNLNELREHISLAEVAINPSDTESIKRGAKFFSTTCMSCHTMVYLKYNNLAKEAGITLDKMPINIKNWPNGVTPPDLSLVANVRGVNWIYTYLHSFYQDTARPTGANNLLVPDTAMPAMLAPFQGEQILASNKMDKRGILYGDIEWFNLLELKKQGSMTPEQFDAAMTDVVNFLAYAAEPYGETQRTIGFYVLAFLVVLFFMMWVLKREYWKDIKRHE